MSIDKDYLDKFIFVTQRAACGAFPQIGKNDKILADKGAVDVMRSELNKIKMDGKIVIGEGEMDEAPMLFIGENLGTKDGQKLDIAVDPLEGTNFVAKNLPNSFSMMAVAERNNLFSAPDTYMEKIAIGSNLPKDLIDLDNSVTQNINILAEALNKKTNELTACVLNRPRHNKIISDLKSQDVNIKLITDGDVFGAIQVVDPLSSVDIYMGIGGGPEGVLAAAALDCLGGQMHTRLVLDKEQSERALKLGIKELKKKYRIRDMIKGDVMFCATAITDGDLLNGIKEDGNNYIATTYALHKELSIIKKISSKIQK